MREQSTLKINEIFCSIQGEGKNTGIPMIFIRLSGCNLRCSFCDTVYAFEAGREMSESEIMTEVNKYRPSWVCITGGEPLMQDISLLIDQLKLKGLNIQIETNGTIFQQVRCDWLVVSPKREREPSGSMLERADEIKVVVNSDEALEEAKKYEIYRACLSVQPENNREEMKKLCMDFVKANPNWRLSMQLHKLIDVD